MARQAPPVFSGRYVDQTKITEAQLDRAIARRDASSVYAAVIKAIRWHSGLGLGKANYILGPIFEILAPFDHHPVGAAAIACFYHSTGDAALRERAKEYITPDIKKGIFELAQKKKDHYAALFGGMLAFLSIGVENDPVLAESMYRQAVKNGDPQAQLQLALFLEVGALQLQKMAMNHRAFKAGFPTQASVDFNKIEILRANYANESARLYMQAARAKHVAAQEKLAALYVSAGAPAFLVQGLSEEQRRERAVELYQAAWDQGHYHTKYEQAHLYRDLGQIDAAIQAMQDVSEKTEFLEVGLLPRIRINMAELYNIQGKHNEARDIFEEYADQDYPPAVAGLAHWHALEKPDHVEDWIECLRQRRRLIELTAAQSNADAYNDDAISAVDARLLGEDGPGSFARVWQRNPDPQSNGHLIPIDRKTLFGDTDIETLAVVPSERGELIDWLVDAAKNGSPQATVLAAIILDEDKRDVETFDMLCLSVERDNNALAGFELAKRFLEGKGTPVNIQMAFELSHDIHRLRRDELPGQLQEELTVFRTGLMKDAWAANAEGIMGSLRYENPSILDTLKKGDVHYFSHDEDGIDRLAAYQENSWYVNAEIALRSWRGQGVEPDNTDIFRRLSNVLVDRRMIAALEEYNAGIAPLDHPMRGELQALWDEVSMTIKRENYAGTDIYYAFDPEADEQTFPYEFNKRYLRMFDTLCAAGKRRFEERVAQSPGIPRQPG